MTVFKVNSSRYDVRIASEQEDLEELGEKLWRTPKGRAWRSPAIIAQSKITRETALNPASLAVKLGVQYERRRLQFAGK